MRKNFVDIAFRHHTVVIFICTMLVIAGVIALRMMKKNEFPDHTVRTGIVAAVYPGATTTQVEKEVTERLEDFVFSYKEVNKQATESNSSNSMSVVKVVLNDECKDANAFWASLKHNINDFKSELPAGVVATRVIDDFGDCTARLITLASDVKTYPQLEEYASQLRRRLRTLDDVSRIQIIGKQREQISIKVDAELLDKYAINRKLIMGVFAANNLLSVSGTTEYDDIRQPIYVDRSTVNEYDVAETVIEDSPVYGTIRLKDITTIKREYSELQSTITDNGKKCILLSVEMKDSRDIVAMGEKVDDVIDEYTKTLPADVEMFTITNQSQVVGDSVSTFLKELLIAILAVVLIVVLLLPVRTALVAASTIPVTVFISIATFWLFNFELNTITLCLLILTLGMIVDDAIVIIDAYLEKIQQWAEQNQQPAELGYIDVPDDTRREASVWAAKHYFPSVLSATLAITATYFPVHAFTRGILNDFLQDFPFGITIILFISLIIAQVLVPYMQYRFIRRPVRHSSPFLVRAQRLYDRIIVWCFGHRKSVKLMGVASVALGIFLSAIMPMRLIPWAERHQFVVEIYTPSGTSLSKTSLVADSLEHMLAKDNRIQRIVSFKGCSSPRFQSTYSPQMGSSNYAQFIVNTLGNKESVELINEYEPKYREYFPEAFVRFRQLNYSMKDYPVEVYVEGENMESLRMASDSIKQLLAEMPNVEKARSTVGNTLPATHVTIKPDVAARFNIHTAFLSTSLASSFSNGVKVSSVWEDGNEVPVVLTSTHGTKATPADVAEESVPTLLGADYVKLHQVADVTTKWDEAYIMHKGGNRVAKVMAEFKREYSDRNTMKTVSRLKDKIESKGEGFLPADVRLLYGGDYNDFVTYMPGIMMSLFFAALINLIIILLHFRKVSTALLLLGCFPMTLLGTSVGILIFGVEFGSTPVLGMVTLLGMLVRNCTIMLDYCEQLRAQGVDVLHACLQSAQRRMRPILLTSLCASMGVIPMIISQNALWMPMGIVIFVGTVFTMIGIVTFIPVAYYLINKKEK